MTKAPTDERAPCGWKARLAKILTGSFIVVMLIHLVVFTALGLFTPAGWRLLWIFLAGLGIMLAVVLPLRYLRRKKPAKTDTDKSF